jgi:hypothetical protein
MISSYPFADPETERKASAIEQFTITAKRQPIDYHSLNKTAFFWRYPDHIPK